MDELVRKFGITIDIYAVLVTWFLVFLRTLLMITFIPFIGGRAVQARVRLVVALVLATFAYWLHYAETPPVLPDEKSYILALAFKEIFLGFVIGMVALTIFYSIEAAGRIVDNQRGSANAQIFSPQLGQVSVFGLFSYWLGIGIFLAANGHIPFFKAYFEGFQTLSVLSMPNLGEGMSPFLTLIIRFSADVLLWGMQLASPVLIAIFLTDTVLGIANKVAPQIPVFELGFVIKGYVGVAMVYISLFVFVGQMDVFFKLMDNNLLRIFQALKP